MKLKKESTIIDTWCSALLEKSVPCGRHLFKTEAFKDTLGHYWCAEHKTRGQLIDWAYMAKWPDVRFGLYALGPTREVWELQVLCGKPEMIEMAVEVLQIGKKEEVA